LPQRACLTLYKPILDSYEKLGVNLKEPIGIPKA